METVRLNFAKLETVYKFRLITKTQIINMLDKDWVSAYRILTGISSDRNLSKHEQFMLTYYPNTYIYITETLFEHDFEYFVSSLEYIKQCINENYKTDLENSANNYPHYIPYKNR